LFLSRFDPDRLRETVASSYRCTLGWKKVLRLAEAKPSPLSFFDATIHMGPAVVLRGDPRAERYYETLAAELQERTAARQSAVDGERHRFYWEGMPVWGKLREHAELFAGQHACVVASTYCNSWIFDGLAAPDPFAGMARAYTELFIVRSEEFKEQYLSRMARDYQIDGVIYHDAKTCPNNSNNRYGLPQRPAERLGIPHIVFNGDLNDLRLYSDEQARTQFEALVEQLT
jgi:benzoyl-CoA reductase/2-hydroxyglutaryl-CoA dehydratase subunit BcrC/BadD/HgdB